MGSKTPSDSFTLGFKSYLNAHVLPVCGPDSLIPHFSLGKLMYRCVSLVLWVLKMGSKILYFSLHIALECMCTAAFDAQYLRCGPYL